MDNYNNFNQVPEEPTGALKWYKKSWGKALIAMAIAIILLISLLACLMFYNYGVDKAEPHNLDGLFNATSSSVDVISTSSSSAPVNANINQIVKDPIRILAEKMDRPLWGNPSSTLVIVEFADFQCSVCEAEFPIIRGFVTKHQNEVLYIFRNDIVIDEVSNLLAQASLCANDQGKFWILHDKFYTNFGSVTSLETLQILVQSLGMDWDKMSTCIQSGKYLGQVVQDMSDGKRLGVAGTPTFFINGKKIEGAVSMEDWEAILLKYKQVAGQE